jgi:hypothetical protein
LQIKEESEMKRLLLILALIAIPATAQEHIQKIVTLKYADPRAINNLLRSFGIETQMDAGMKVIVLSGIKERVATAEDAIKQLDVPSSAQKNIELTIYFVAGTDQANPGGSAIPPDLQSTVATLKSTFPFKTYSLLDVLALRTRSGVGAQTSGELSGSRLTFFRVDAASVDGDGSMIRLDRLHAGIKIPLPSGEGKINYTDTGISTDVVDVKEGQKLVVGRSSLDGPEKALFLVLIAKIIN